MNFKNHRFMRFVGWRGDLADRYAPRTIASGATCFIPARAKQNAPALDQGVLADSSDLEQVPEELVVDLVVELDFLRFDESAQRARTTIRGGLFQVGITALHVFAEQRGDPLRFAEVVESVVNVVGQVALGLTQVLDLRGLTVEAGLED